MALIRAGRVRRVDVGRVDQDPGSANSQPFHFLNIIGAGLPVDAMRAAEHIKFVGRSAYSLAAFWCAMKMKSYPLSIELDGELIEQDALFVEISNTRYTGTHFLMAPGARLDDGLLDLTLVRRLPRGRLLRLFPTIYHGGHVAFEEVLTRQARRFASTPRPAWSWRPTVSFRGRRRFVSAVCSATWTFSPEGLRCPVSRCLRCCRRGGTSRSAPAASSAGPACA